MMSIESLAIRYDGKKLEVLDQQMLPDTEEWVEAASPVAMIKIIKALKVRGAPLIGVSAALSLALWSEKAKDFEEFKRMAEELKDARPTAVNLMHCVDRLLLVARQSDMDHLKIKHEAETIFSEDVELCDKMAAAGVDLIKPGDQILTHCNTGSLATAGAGTALAVIKKAHHMEKDIHVYVDETRPLLQGGRLTTWELEKEEIPYSLITDSMAGWLMHEGKIDKIFVGADRIAINGDFANKIGTYSLAVLADHHDIPFYVVAPRTTVDPKCQTGEDIEIEQRKPEEVRGVYGTFGQIRWAPENSQVFNPAFDVTPADLVTAYVIDGGVVDTKMIAVGHLSKFQLS